MLSKYRAVRGLKKKTRTWSRGVTWPVMIRHVAGCHIACDIVTHTRLSDSLRERPVGNRKSMKRSRPLSGDQLPNPWYHDRHVLFVTTGMLQLALTCRACCRAGRSLRSELSTMCIVTHLVTLPTGAGSSMAWRRHWLESYGRP